MTRTPIPTSALALGLAGLAPFMACALASALDLDLPLIGDASRALIAYGAVILSFLGGVRWGLALRMAEEGAQARQLALSVCPSIAGWLALLAPTAPAIAAMLILVLLLGFADQRLPAVGAPDWYPRLRVLLTGAVAVALTVALLGVWI